MPKRNYSQSILQHRTIRSDQEIITYNISGVHDQQQQQEELL